MSLSYKQRLELATFGYIRLNYQEDIIDDIKRICLDYYTTIEFCWDAVCGKLSKFVSNRIFAFSVETDVLKFKLQTRFKTLQDGLI